MRQAAGLVKVKIKERNSNHTQSVRECSEIAVRPVVGYTAIERDTWSVDHNAQKEIAVVAGNKYNAKI